MYLSLLRLNPASAAVQRDLRDIELLHHTIMKAYPNIIDLEKKARELFGVLYRVEIDRRLRLILLYVQSRIEPDWTILPGDYLCPTDGMANPATKTIDDAYNRIKNGQTLRFRLRANPTRKVDTKSGADGQRRNGKRVPLYNLEDQVNWLTRKANNGGFALLQTTVAASGASEILRSSSTGRMFQGVLYEGHLQVTDTALFQKTLAQGIGPGKAFGFGLLSVGPS